MVNLWAKIQSLIARAILIQTNDNDAVQKITIKGPQKGELHEDVVHHQIYGLSVHAPNGAIPLILESNGERSQLTALNPHHAASRPTNLAQGDVVLYTMQGQHIKLYNNGDIDITTKRNVTVNADKVVVNSDNIDLGGVGGAKIARIGDMVNVGAGSSAGQWPIISGSSKVRAL